MSLKSMAGLLGATEEVSGGRRFAPAPVTGVYELTNQYAGLSIALAGVWWLLASFGVFYAWERGWIMEIHTADFTHISHAIVLVFGFGALRTTLSIGRCSWYLNALKSTGAASQIVRELLTRLEGLSGSERQLELELIDDELYAPVESSQEESNLLAYMGFAGTLIGLALALWPLRELTSVEDIKLMIPEMMPGLYVVFYTSIVGIVLHKVLDLLIKVQRMSSRKCLACIIRLSRDR